MAPRGVNNSNELQNVALLIMVPRVTGGGVTTIVSTEITSGKKGTFAASWRSFYKSMNHAEELGQIGTPEVVLYGHYMTAI